MKAHIPMADVLTDMDIPSADKHPPQIEPQCTEPYYTKPVAHIDKYRHRAIEPDYMTYI